MKVKILALLIFLLTTTLILTQFVFAQEVPTPIPTGNISGTTDLGTPYTMECINVDTYVGVCHKHFGRCEEDINVLPIQPATFSGNCPSTKPCHIAICASKSAQSQHCTTFDPALDENYQFEGTAMETACSDFNTGEARSCFPDDITVHTFTPGEFSVKGNIMNAANEVNYSFYAIYEPETIAPTSSLGQGGEDNNGENPSVQLGTVQFAFPTEGQPLPTGTQEKCSPIYWDPYGRVFDAVSLEPLGKNEARVSLYHENGNLVNTPSNNSSIDILGKYNIFVKEDGKYTLKVDSMLLHDFVSVNPDPRYTDLYGEIYKLGDPAFEEKQSNPKRIDIPVKPKSTPYKRDVEWVYKNQNIVMFEGEEYTKIEFRVTHPLTKIKTNIKGEVKCSQTKSDFTDKDGICLIMVKNSLIPQEGIKIELIKNADYYLYGKKTESQQTIKIGGTTINNNLFFDPILRHVEGYVYDENKEVIPGAKVEVVLTNNKVFYRTTADDSGFFTIYKSNLPPQEYYLKFNDSVTSKSTTESTSQFVNNNESYLTTEKINLMKATKNEQLLVNPISGKLNKIDKNYQPTTPKTTDKNLATDNKAGFPFDFKKLIIFLILFLLFGAVIGIVVYIKKQSKDTLK